LAELSIAEIEKLEAAVTGNVTLSSALERQRYFPNARSKLTKIYERLSKNERPVFANLISRYELYTEYTEAVSEIFLWLKAIIDAGEKITLATPYMAPAATVKSATHVVYELKSFLSGWGYTDEHFNSRTTLPEKAKPGRRMIIVDDFSGTGGTIEKAVVALLDKGQPTDKIVVCLVYAMAEAVTRLLALGVPVITYRVGQKALGDHNFGPDDGGAAAAIYDGIEQRLGHPEHQKYRRGYGASESLVTMMRTPNNTLPIFWYAGLTEQLAWPCPFPRGTK
jgi:hypothetical protein